MDLQEFIRSGITLVVLHKVVTKLIKRAFNSHVSSAHLICEVIT